jgi:hypothetical protein
MSEIRYYVSFTVRPYVPGERWAWPLLFPSREGAEHFMREVGSTSSTGIFANKDTAIPGRRIISAAVQHVRIK